MDKVRNDTFTDCILIRTFHKFRLYPLFNLHICTLTNLHIDLMASLKKLLGLIWMFLAPLIVAVMVWQAADKIEAATAATKTNAALQWIIILFVFIPICAGLFIFGFYSFKGYYDDPANNRDIP